jgi:hypothetical protein
VVRQEVALPPGKLLLGTHAPDRCSFLARPWPNPRIENRTTLLALQLWLEELRDWDQSLAGLDASLLQPIIVARADRSLELRYASSRNSLGSARLAALLHEAACALDYESRRLRCSVSGA